MKITAFGMSDVGKVRSNNEDNYVIYDVNSGQIGNIPDPVDIDEGILLLVADGMGGAAAGEIASETVVSVSTQYIKDNFSQKPEDIVPQALIESHLQCHRIIQENPSYNGMGSVATLGFLSDKSLYVGQIGDSRLYLYRNKTLIQITEDQNFVSELVKIGIITPEQAIYHPQRNAVTQAVGAMDAIVPAVNRLDLEPGDKLLFCSDGLNSMVGDIEIQIIVESYTDLEETVQELINTANHNGGYDNITLILAEVFS